MVSVRVRVRVRARVRVRVRVRVNNEDYYNVRLNCNELAECRCVRQQDMTYYCGFYEKRFVCPEGPRCGKFEKKAECKYPCKER